VDKGEWDKGKSQDDVVCNIMRKAIFTLF
jgi:hypothetical protein